jgi:hypothetical protein
LGDHAQSQKEPARLEVPAEIKKLGSEQLKARALEKVIWFDAQRLEQRLEAATAAPDIPQPAAPAVSQPPKERRVVAASLASAKLASLDVPQEINFASERSPPTTQGESVELLSSAETVTSEQVLQDQSASAPSRLLSVYQWRRMGCQLAGSASRFQVSEWPCQRRCLGP